MFSKSNILLFLFLTAFAVYFSGILSDKTVSNTDIGADFSLVSHTGQNVNSATYQDKPRLVYFGYTYCPDICPIGLANMHEAMQQLRADAPVGLFITIDPARDTQEEMAAYMQNFPGIIGLTGDPAQIKAMAQEYKSHYKKVENKQEPQNYMMDHSNLIYLMDGQGKYMLHFAHTTKPAEMVARIKKALSSEW